MIFDILFVIVGVILGAIATVLQALTHYVVPNFFDGLVQGWVDAMYQLNHFVPMVKNVSATGMWSSVGILDLFSWFIGVYLTLKAVKIAYHLFSALPWFSPKTPIIK